MAYARTAPAGTTPEAMSNTCASHGNSPNTRRTGSNFAESANHTARGTAQTKAIAAAAAPAALAVCALAHTAAALQAAPCTASPRKPDRNDARPDAAHASGAYHERNANDETRNRTGAIIVADHTPRNFPHASSNSRAGDASSMKTEPLEISALHVYIPANADTTGRNGAAETAHNEASEHAVPSADSMLKAKSAADPARYAAYANAAVYVERTMPTVRLNVAAAGLTPPSPSARPARAPRLQRRPLRPSARKPLCAPWTARETSSPISTCFQVRGRWR